MDLIFVFEGLQKLNPCENFRLHGYNYTIPLLLFRLDMGYGWHPIYS